MQRRAVLGLALAAALAAIASDTSQADPGHQPYILGVVLERIAGRNAALVDVRWSFSCYPQLTADARYEYSIALVRLSPAPQQSRRVVSDTVAAGTVRLQLTPGRYRADGDPFFCLATIRDTKTLPERGLPFEVPDFCDWETLAVRGRATAKGRVLSAGDSVRPGETLSLAPGASASLRNEPAVAAPASASSLAVSGGSRAEVERGSCVARGGWRIRLAKGQIVAKAGENSAPHQVVTTGSVSSGRAATWSVSVAGPTTRVRVTHGTVVLSTRAGRRTLRAGTSEIVRG